MQHVATIGDPTSRRKVASTDHASRSALEMQKLVHHIRVASQRGCIHHGLACVNVSKCRVTQQPATKTQRKSDSKQMKWHRSPFQRHGCYYFPMPKPDANQGKCSTSKRMTKANAKAKAKVNAKAKAKVNANANDKQKPTRQNRQSYHAKIDSNKTLEVVDTVDVKKCELRPPAAETLHGAHVTFSSGLTFSHKHQLK